MQAFDPVILLKNSVLQKIKNMYVGKNPKIHLLRPEVVNGMETINVEQKKEIIIHKIHKIQNGVLTA